jgi:hypothetical protein
MFSVADKQFDRQNIFIRGFGNAKHIGVAPSPHLNTPGTGTAGLKFSGWAIATKQGFGQTFRE